VKSEKGWQGNKAMIQENRLRIPDLYSPARRKAMTKDARRRQVSAGLDGVELEL
jgi:hypothetical protein